MRRLWRSRLSAAGEPRLWLAVALALSLAVAIAGLVWLSYSAVAQWRTSAEELVEQRSEGVLTLLAVALNQDMKGAHSSVLASLNDDGLKFDRLYDVAGTFARAFARFPYPESFFIWRDEPGPTGETYFFNRTDRLPPWDTDARVVPAFPVAARHDPAAVRHIVDLSRRVGSRADRFAVFESKVNGVQYQMVVHRLFHLAGTPRVHALVGFMVNLDWVRREYFPDLLHQIARMAGVEDSLSLLVLDDTSRIVASSSRSQQALAGKHARTFPVVFADTSLAVFDPPHWAPSQWAVRVQPADDRGLIAASTGATRTLWLISLAAAAALCGLAVTVGAVRASMELAAMKSEFVSSATHELKTPLVSIQLVGDTLARGRYDSAETIREYAEMLRQQAQLLARLIDNLLAYASLGEVRRHAFESTSLSELVDSALERFDARLAATGMEVRVDVPATLPRIAADRQTILQALDNVIDNAIKYSPGTELLKIRGWSNGPTVHVEVSDEGVGIPAEERGMVFRKFYRGKAAATGGSGLGLAIAQRVVADHGGTIEIRGHEPRGTTVDLAFPVAGLS